MSLDINHLATLSNLTVSPPLSKKLASQFADTLKVVDELNSLDTSELEATPQVNNLQNIFRDDVIDTNRQFSQEEALQNAQKQFKGYFVVKRVGKDL